MIEGKTVVSERGQGNTGGKPAHKPGVSGLPTLLDSPENFNEVLDPLKRLPRA